MATTRPVRASKRAVAAGLVLVAAGAFCAAWPPASAAAPEWRINSAQTIEDQPNYTVEGPIVVALGGALTIRNSTILFNQTIEGGLKLEVLSGGSVTIENSTLRSSDSARGLGLHWNFLVSGHLDARRADISDLRGDAGLGGIEANSGDVLIEESTIHHNRYYGIMLKAGAARVRNTTFEANVVAVFVTPGASPVLEGLVIRNSTGFGLKVNDASPVVRNLTVTGGMGFGVGAVGGILDIEGCRISGVEVAVDAVQGTTGRLEQCQFLTVGTGVRARESPLRVADSTFFGAAIGVNATSSAVVVSGNSFSGVAVGVRAAGAQPVGEIGEGTGNDFAGNGVAFEIYVPSFFLEGNTFGPNVTGSRIFHTLELLIVNASGSPARHAKVEIHAADGAAAFTGFTNDTGAVTAVLEEFRLLSNGSRQNMTPHAVRIETPGLVTQTHLNATSDRVERITLAAPPVAGIGGVSREAILLLGLAVGAAAGAGALGMRVRRKRARQKAADRHERAGRRRGPRSGR